MQHRDRPFGQAYPLRISQDAQARLDAVAAELKSDRAKIARALIVEAIGLADPITAEIARLARETAERMRPVGTAA